MSIIHVMHDELSLGQAQGLCVTHGINLNCRFYKNYINPTQK